MAGRKQVFSFLAQIFGPMLNDSTPDLHAAAQSSEDDEELEEVHGDDEEPTAIAVVTEFAEYREEGAFGSLEDEPAASEVELVHLDDGVVAGAGASAKRKEFLSPSHNEEPEPSQNLRRQRARVFQW